MSEKSLILSVIIIIAVVAAAIGVYYFMSMAQKPVTPPVVNTKNTTAKAEIKIPPTIAQQLEQIKKDYPEVITGVIKFFDTKTSLKTTIKTDDGKEYILWPSQPESVYKSFGAKNGGRVEIQAKVPENGKIIWGLMKPI